MFKKLIPFSLTAVLLAGALIITDHPAHAASKVTLEKQVKSLKTENSKLKSENNKLKADNKKKDSSIKTLTKDKQILSAANKQQKKDLVNKDKQIKSLQSNAGTAINAKLGFQETYKSGTYSSQKVPVLLSYKGVPYAPVNLVASLFGVGYSYNSKLKTYYLGEGTSGVYMDDKLEPYAGDGNVYYAVDYDDGISAGGIKYKHGITFATGANAYYNLDKKYSALSGKIGTEDYDSGNGTIYFYGDGKLIKKYSIKYGQLPYNFSLNVKNVRKFVIKAVSDDEDDFCTIALLNPKLK